MKSEIEANNILEKLLDLREKVSKGGESSKILYSRFKPSQRKSAKNFVQYLAARQIDLRSIQDDLHSMGLSSLASSEGNFLNQVDLVINWLQGKPNAVIKANSNNNTLLKNSKALLGEPINKFIPQIMVTYDSDFAEDLNIINKLIHHGMAIARINCAHDNELQWAQMIENTKTAQELNNKSCKIYMDLPGPKIRTKILGKGKNDKRVKISEGELFWLAEENAKFKKRDTVIGITLNGILCQLNKGDHVLFDDGLMEAVVEEKGESKVLLMMKRVSTKKGLLKAEKGVNFPNNSLQLQSLTNFDESCLPFITTHADMLGFSFVQQSSDIHTLYEKLAELGKSNFPIVLKIETQAAVTNLPELLLTAMEYGSPAVMIARGDLAVEIGFERLSEIQDEIMWLCEAAHVPVIWATQVLENLNKSGVPTRSEITDAAHASMAECVLINKGPHTVQVLKTLKDILNKNGRHHWKKRNMMRPLAIASQFFKN
jgi:pyruvate kinase